MPGLTDKDLERFDQRLRKRREELREVIRQELAGTQREGHAELAGMVHDASDESFAEFLHGINFTIRVREFEEIRDVEAALARLRNGTYGTCVECSDAIAVERLDAYPTVKRCITCQSRHENRRGGRDATPSL